MSIFRCFWRENFMARKKWLRLVKKAPARRLALQQPPNKTFFKNLTFSGQGYKGGQKNLGPCETALPSNCYVGPCSWGQFFVRLWVHPVVPPHPSPSNVVAKKSTHFHPFCSILFGVGGDRTPNVAPTSSRKWELNSNWANRGKGLWFDSQQPFVGRSLA